MKKTNLKTVTLATALMLLLSLPFAAFAQYEENRGLFGRGGSSADYSYGSGESLMRQGEPNVNGGITNDSFGAPLGSGLAILIAAGAGYAVVRRKRSRKNTMLLLACVALLGFTQCKKEQPQEPEAEVKQVNITLNVGGSTNSGSRHDINTTTGAVDFKNGDVIYVGDGNTYIGTLTHNGTSFSGSITEPANNTEIYFYYVGGLTPSVTPSAGSTSSFTVDISDQSSQMPVLSCSHVTYHTGTSSYSCVLQNHCALVQFTNLSTSAPVHVGGLYTEALIDFENNCITNNGTTGFINLKSESKTAKWAVLLPQTSFVDVEGVVADYGYNITMPAAIEADAFLTGENAVRFGSSSSHNKYLQWAITGTTLENGDHVYGTLAGNYKVSVAAGATVTLRDATINGVHDWDYEWAGITCLGNATIILEGTNTVKGFSRDYPGIQAAHNNTGVGDEYTLTIQGTGSLTASSNGKTAGIGAAKDDDCGNITISGGTITATGGDQAAGIGGSNYGECGNISISGGNITASGGDNAAGIGSGEGRTCGNITISGGTITATGNDGGAGIGTGGTGASCGNIFISGGTITATGGSKGAGIGTGKALSCGSITITSDVNSVTATKGASATNSIGVGGQGTCGTVTIGGTVYWDETTPGSGTYEYKNGGAAYLATSPLVYPTPAPSAPTGAIDGLFTVNSSGDQVYFSQGNLQATTTDNGANWSWAFATNQWDYIGNATANNSINGNGTVSANGTVDLFGWVGANSSFAAYGINNSQTNADYGNVVGEGLKSDWGNTIGSGWRTLTGGDNGEWKYIISTRNSGSTVNGTSNARYTHATINIDVTSVNGIILFPDGITIASDEATLWGNVNSNSGTWASATKCTSAQWTALAAKGCVFLPAAGRRYGKNVEVDGTYGSYYSSTSPGSSGQNCYSMCFEQTYFDPVNGVRSCGRSVRLVKDVN